MSSTETFYISILKELYNERKAIFHRIEKSAKKFNEIFGKSIKPARFFYNKKFHFAHKTTLYRSNAILKTSFRLKEAIDAVIGLSQQRCFYRKSYCRQSWERFKMLEDVDDENNKHSRRSKLFQRNKPQICFIQNPKLFAWNNISRALKMESTQILKKPHKF